MSFPRHVLSADVQQRIKDAVTGPLHANVVPLEPGRPNKDLSSIQVGDCVPFFQPTGDVQHEIVLQITEKDETLRESWRYSITGFWSASMKVTLSLPFPMRGEVPVWVLHLHGVFNEGIIGNKEVSNKVEQHLMRAEKKRLDHPNRYFPRGAPFKDLQEHLIYDTQSFGGPLKFWGEEWVTDEGENGERADVLWSAHFHGGLLVPIS